MSKKNLENPQKNINFADKNTYTMNKIGLFCASSNNLDAIYYEEAARLGRWLAENDKTLVYGGANCGLMEACAKAVFENKGNVMGIVPQILFDRKRVSNNITVTVPCADLNDRKQLLINNSDIIIVMPGSVGTLDEAFTVMAANTIGIHDKRLILWNVNGFWTELFLMFEALVKKGVVNKPLQEMYMVANTFDELVALL